MSWLRAEQTGTWYIGGNGEIGRDNASGKLPSYDAGRINAFMQTIDQHNAAWKNWFTSHGIDPFRVRYEELDADMGGVTQGILTFLGLEAPDRRRMVPRHKRQADGLSNQWIDRYRAESAPD
ncbi:Stf0 family sulfotransferase [Streptomyces sp. NPDC086077]|uniref:Stf0 family sulfotransferase n=1 Tax=Streptomyces sp. NPDC086077 TaxID=3154862 RepID=UPI003446F753